VRDGVLVVSQQVIKAVEADVNEVAQDEASAVEASPEPAKKKTTKKKAADK
jgi:hypothetical protein